MDLHPTPAEELNKEQKIALKKADEVIATFLEGMQSIANNQLLNTKSFDLAKQHAVTAAMFFNRAIAKPNEK